MLSLKKFGLDKHRVKRVLARFVFYFNFCCVVHGGYIADHGGYMKDGGSYMHSVCSKDANASKNANRIWRRFLEMLNLSTPSDISGLVQ